MNATADKMSISIDDLADEFSEDEATDLTFIDDQDYLQQNFVFIHGSDCVWDRQFKRIMKVSHLKLSAPISYKLWQSNPSRQWINNDDLVFDPQHKRGGHCINMFTGFKMVPAKGNVMPIVDHLYQLCGGDDAVVDWIIKWIAYPLQNVGAKMASAIVFHGPEGTGKNLFWDLVLEIYGCWGVAISQSQIETEFNAWMSSKLFVLANEVLSNRERRHIKGRLKALITEPTIMINQKSMPVRDESNHANFVFLSNESQPIDTDSSDRRFMVVECTEIHPAAYYKKLKAEIDVPAFYEFLMTYPLGDFYSHTPVLTTKAKTELLRQNLRSEQLFIQDWLAGDVLDYPLQDIPSRLLYDAYRVWCHESGERYPVTETKFGRAINDARLNKGRANVRDFDLNGLADGSRKIIMIFLKVDRSSVEPTEWSDFLEIVIKKQRLYGFIKT